MAKQQRPDRNLIGQLKKQLKSKQAQVTVQSAPKDQALQPGQQEARIKTQNNLVSKVATTGAAIIAKGALEQLQQSVEEVRALENQQQQVQVAQAVQAASTAELAQQEGLAASKAYQGTQEELEKQQEKNQQAQLARAKRQAEAKRKLQQRQSFLQQQKEKLNPIKIAEDQSFKLVADWTIPGYYIYDKAKDLTRRILFGPEKT